WRVNGPMWSVGVRLSLLAVVTLPSASVWLTTTHQRDVLNLHAAYLATPLMLALVVGALIGFVTWNTTAFKNAVLSISFGLYSMALLGWIYTDEGPRAFRRWAASDWLVFATWVFTWGLVFWCLWILVRNVFLTLILRLRQRRS